MLMVSLDVAPGRVIGNFKMNGTMESLKSLVTALDEAKLDSNTGECSLPLRIDTVCN